MGNRLPSAGTTLNVSGSKSTAILGTIVEYRAPGYINAFREDFALTAFQRNHEQVFAIVRVPGVTEHMLVPIEDIALID